MLMNVTTPGDDSYCFAVGSLSKTNFGKDDKSGSDNLRIFTKAGSTAGKFCLGFSKNKSTGTYIDAEYDTGTTYLVVLKYEFVDGTGNDICSIWVNPATDAKQEPTAALTTSTGADFSANNGVNILILRQGDRETSLDIFVACFAPDDIMGRALRKFGRRRSRTGADGRYNHRITGSLGLWHDTSGRPRIQDLRRQGHKYIERCLPIHIIG